MIRSIVVAIKPGVPAQPLLDLATSVVGKDASLHLLSLVPVGVNDDERQRLHNAEEGLAALQSDLRERGWNADATVHLSSMGLGGHLVGVAEELGADLIVLGFSKRSRVGKALIGSDAQAVLLQATCPVLAARLP